MRQQGPRVPETVQKEMLKVSLIGCVEKNKETSPLPFFLPSLQDDAVVHPAKSLKMVMADNAELLALSGSRSPFIGKLGVVEEEALADLLLVNGNPLADRLILENPQNLTVIMKNGKVYQE